MILKKGFCFFLLCNIRNNCEQINDEEYKKDSRIKIEILNTEKQQPLHDLKSKTLKAETPQTVTPQNKC